MAPLTKGAGGDLEEGGILSSKCNAAIKATEGNCANKRSQNSNAHGLWGCLLFGSGVGLCICFVYDKVEGPLPSAAMWLAGIAAVVMLVSFFGLVCTAKSRSINDNEVRVCPLDILSLLLQCDIDD
jgi:hypothetical protein